MRVQSAMADAFTKAAFKAAIDYGRDAPWVARQVADRLQYTTVGQVSLERRHQQPAVGPVSSVTRI